jgi:endoglucanase
MQDLVDIIRSTGAKNLILIPGINYSNSLVRWIQVKPNDILNNIAPSWHTYNFNRCNTTSCWDSTIDPLNKLYPIFAGEIGEDTCDTKYIQALINWLDARKISYLGWTFNPWVNFYLLNLKDCKRGPSLISDFNGTPTNYGMELFKRLNRN